MFAVLHQESSDEEDKPKRQTKHEQRAEDKQKREAYGDKVDKENTKQAHKEKAAKEDYTGQGKRQYDRHSGTGKNTFNKYEKKGGQGGKGNWGSENVDVEPQAEGEAKKEANDQPEEQAEPVLTLDDYLKDNKMDLEYQVSDQQVEQEHSTYAEKGFKVFKKEEADYTEAHTKNANVDNLAKVKTNQIEGDNSNQRQRNNDRNKKPAKKTLNNDDFPALG